MENKKVVRFEPTTDRSALIQSLKDQKEELYRQLNSLSGIILQHGFIVVTSRLNAIRFSAGEDQKLVDPTVCRVTLATRMTEEKAKEIAAKTFNGNGECGEAVHVRTALARQIDALNDCISLLEV